MADLEFIGYGPLLDPLIELINKILGIQNIYL